MPETEEKAEATPVVEEPAQKPENNYESAAKELAKIKMQQVGLNDDAIKLLSQKPIQEQLATLDLLAQVKPQAQKPNAPKVAPTMPTLQPVTLPKGVEKGVGDHQFFTHPLVAIQSKNARVAALAKDMGLK